MNPFRGSRKHVLDWVERPAFRAELSDLISPTGAVVGDTDAWLPRSAAESEEARLERYYVIRPRDGSSVRLFASYGRLSELRLIFGLTLDRMSNRSGPTGAADGPLSPSTPLPR